MVNIILPPYDQYSEFKQKIDTTFKAMRRAIKIGNRILALVNAFYLGQCMELIAETQIERLLYRTKIPEHYRRIATKTYYIFETLGVSQIQRTKFTTIAMIQKLNKSIYRKLVNKATKLSQEL